MPLLAVDVCSYRRLILNGDRSEIICFQSAFPVFAGLRRFPSEITYRGLCKRDAFINRDPRIVSRQSSDFAVPDYCLSKHLLFLRKLESCEIRIAVAVECEEKAVGSVGELNFRINVSPVVVVFDRECTEDLSADLCPYFENTVAVTSDPDPCNFTVPAVEELEAGGR